MSNTTISKTILISGLNDEISRGLNILKHRVELLHVSSNKAEYELKKVISASKEILELIHAKSQLLDSEENIFNFPTKNKDVKKASAENTKKPKRKN